MLRNNENDMFLHTHLFTNTTKVNRAKRGALRLIMEGAHPMQASPSEKPRKRATYEAFHLRVHSPNNVYTSTVKVAMYDA